MAKDISITLRISEDLLETIDEAAERLDMSRSEYIRWAAQSGAGAHSVLTVKARRKIQAAIDLAVAATLEDL